MTALSERELSRRNLLKLGVYGAGAFLIGAVAYEVGQGSTPKAAPNQPDNNPFPGESIPISNPNSTDFAASSAASHGPSIVPTYSPPEATSSIIPSEVTATAAPTKDSDIPLNFVSQSFNFTIQIPGDWEYIPADSKVNWDRLFSFDANAFIDVTAEKTSGDLDAFVNEQIGKLDSKTQQLEGNGVAASIEGVPTDYFNIHDSRFNHDSTNYCLIKDGVAYRIEVGTVDGYADQYGPILAQAMQTFKITESAPTISPESTTSHIKSPDGVFELDYPSDWNIQNYHDGYPEILIQKNPNDLDEGQVDITYAPASEIQTLTDRARANTTALGTKIGYAEVSDEGITTSGFPVPPGAKESSAQYFHFQHQTSNGEAVNLTRALSIFTIGDYAVARVETFLDSQAKDTSKDFDLINNSFKLSQESATASPSEQVADGFELFTSPAGWPTFTIQYKEGMELEKDVSIPNEYVERFYANKQKPWDGLFIVGSFLNSDVNNNLENQMNFIPSRFNIIDTNSLGKVPLGNEILADGSVYHIYDSDDPNKTEVTWAEFTFTDNNGVFWSFGYGIYTSQEEQFSQIANPMIISFNTGN